MSSVLNVLFTRALNVLLPPTTPVVVCTVDPSFCISDLRRHIDHGQYDELLKKARTAEEGSRQLIWGALAPQPYAVEGEERYRGAYITDNAVSPPSPWVLSEEGKVMQDKAWVRVP